jgi:hypothetical protein
LKSLSHVLGGNERKPTLLLHLSLKGLEYYLIHSASYRPTAGPHFREDRTFCSWHGEYRTYGHDLL